VTTASGDHGFTTESKRLLDPVDRISEILFGLLMAVTFVGSISIATAGEEEVRTVLFAALGCNLAWGLVDAVMFLVRELTEKTRRHSLALRIRAADAADAHRMIALALPTGLAALVGPAELEAMRCRLIALPAGGRPRLTAEDWLSALGVFLLVVVATFPVVLPFVFLHDLPTAMKFSRYITLAMLYAAGHGLGRYAGHTRPAVTGILMALLGAALILAIMALGG
jgi:VIT1/CCC1 family predicted Fe2+/Mn2+ transporter